MAETRFTIIATPHHKEVPYNDLAVRTSARDSILMDSVASLVMQSIDNVRRNGGDMRDDWAIVLRFTSGGLA